MCCKTSFSKHSMMIGMSVTGLSLLRSSEPGFFGTWIILTDFKQDGMVACDREMLKNPCEDPSELVSTGLEHFALYSIWSSSLPWVH